MVNRTNNSKSAELTDEEYQEFCGGTRNEYRN
jgi:hypothetical protein